MTATNLLGASPQPDQPEQSEQSEHPQQSTSSGHRRSSADWTHGGSLRSGCDGPANDNPATDGPASGSPVNTPDKTCGIKTVESPGALARRFHDLDLQRRNAEAALVALVDEVDRSGAYRADGHLSVSGWCKALGKYSHAEANDRVRTARLARHLAQVGIALADGTLGVAQSHELARVFANPRCGDRLVEVIDIFLDVAPELSHKDFCILVRRWENLADVDGAHGAAGRAHDRRRASVINTMGGVHVDAHGPALAGSAMAEVFERFCQAEFDADWAAARAEFGDDVTEGKLARTRSQRQFDAFQKIFEQAAAAAPGSRPAEPLVNIHIDEKTLNNAIHADDPEWEGHLDPIDPLRRRCETGGGTPLAPGEVLAAALAGRVRRIVTRADGVILDMGRRQRLFTGGVREAALLGAHTCVWPGCDIPASRCQADHVVDWRHAGETSAGNGAPMCGYHNRFKNNGHTPHRDARGLWHVLRPDGSEIR